MLKKLILIVLCLMMLIACNTSKEEKMQIYIQGHRGCRGLMPENSIPGFLHALSHGVNTLELDVIISADSEVVVSHEAWLNHEICSDLNGERIAAEKEKEYNLFAMTYAEIERYDCGMQVHPRFPLQKKMAVKKPLLRELFSAIETEIAENNLSRVRYNIEIKSTLADEGIFHPKVDVFCELVAKVIKEANLMEHVQLQSFDFRVLRYLRKHYPEIPLAMLIEESGTPDAYLKQLGFVPEVYSPYYKLVDVHLIDFCKKHKMRLIPWTVNELEDIESLLRLGVHGIISDYPDRVIAVLENKKSK
jgi:glycerophosphoryl diester phosphodiesterase